MECWIGDDLAGGLYGVAFDRVFCGESMFSRSDNASKVALVWLVALLKHAGFRLLDCQFMTDHLATLGAVPITQARYVTMLREAREFATNPVTAMTLPDAYVSLLSSDSPSSDASSPPPSSPPASSPGKLIAQSFIHTS